ncbi:MAG: helix-turn-helix transcriptional regulator [Rhodobacter sp.]|nr:helix-turn-helix transcriptional regulator [Rhodobacter sp.]
MKHDRRLSGFHHRLDQKILEAGLSYRELSLRIGRGETYIATMVRNRNDPGLSTVVDICDALGIELADLTDNGTPQAGRLVTLGSQDVDDIAEALIAAAAERARRALNAGGVHPTIDDLLEWWHSNGGRLENFDQFREKVDLFAAPSHTAVMPVPVQLGHDSLVAQKFGLHDENHLAELLPQLDDRRTKMIVDAHKEAASGRPVLSVEQLDVVLPSGNTEIHAKYKRLLLPVHDPSGNTLVLNYSKHIR